MAAAPGSRGRAMVPREHRLHARPASVGGRHWLRGTMRMADWQHLAAVAWPLVVALLIGLVLRRTLLAAARRARAREDSLFARVVQVIAVPAAVALPLVFLAFAVAATPLPRDTVGQVQHWIWVGVLLSATWLAVRAVAAVEARIIREHPVDLEDNLAARRVQTQARVIARVVQGVVILVGVALALMTFPAIRQVGATLLASAGIIGLVAGIAAKPVFGNLIAGLQIALAQPIRLDDVVIVEGEWGRIEEITSTYVVVRIWDWRRLIVPLQWFIENPFQNWTRQTSSLIGSVFFWVDYAIEIEPLRAELDRILKEVPHLWDGEVKVLQVTDNNEKAMQLRILASSKDSSLSWDLRCFIREKIISYIACNYPQSLPLLRASLEEEAHTAQAPQAPTEPERQPPV